MRAAKSTEQTHSARTRRAKSNGAARKPSPARKQTSPAISTLAAALLAQCPKRGAILVEPHPGFVFRLCSVRRLRSLCASALGQDETPLVKLEHRERKVGG